MTLSIHLQLDQIIPALINHTQDNKVIWERHILFPRYYSTKISNLGVSIQLQQSTGTISITRYNSRVRTWFICKLPYLSHYIDNHFRSVTTHLAKGDVDYDAFISLFELVEFDIQTRRVASDEQDAQAKADVAKALLTILQQS